MFKKKEFRISSDLLIGGLEFSVKTLKGENKDYDDNSTEETLEEMEICLKYLRENLKDDIIKEDEKSRKRMAKFMKEVSRVRKKNPHKSNKDIYRVVLEGWKK